VRSEAQAGRKAGQPVGFDHDSGPTARRPDAAISGSS
jgi:hypothetical protein